MRRIEKDYWPKPEKNVALLNEQTMMPMKTNRLASPSALSPHAPTHLRVPLAARWICAALLALAQCVLGAAPPNDQCSGAIPLVFGPYLDPVTHAMKTGSATATGDPLPVCQASFGKGVWYYITSRLDAVMMIDTCGSGFDTVVQAYTGSCGALTPLACNNDDGSECSGIRASIYFRVTTGQPCWVLAGGLAGASGDLTIRARLGQVNPTAASPYTRVAITNVGGMILANVRITYGDSCGTIKKWGTAVRSGTDFIADAECLRMLGYGCAAVLVTKTNTYQLGRLAPGNYSFAWRNFGAFVISTNFTVAGTRFDAASTYSGGVFRGRLYCPAGERQVIERSTNFVTWTPVATNSTGASPFNFTNTTALPRAFYRARIVP